MKISNNSKILILLFVIATVLLSGHAAQTIFPWVQYVEFFSAALSIIILGFSDRQKEVTGGTILFLLLSVMVVCTLITQLFEGFTSYIRFYCFIVTAYTISQIYSFRDMVRCFRAIMTVVSIVAILGHILLQSTEIMEYLPVYENVNGKAYGFSFIYSYLKLAPERNCGMFWEPGVFATKLTFALVFELMFVEKTDWKRLVIYSVAMFTANSSAGFALWFFCILLMVVRKTSTEQMSLVQMVGSLIAVIVAIAVIYNFDAILAQTALGENAYFQKLSTDRVADSSRMAALAHNIEVFWKNPVFGEGFVKVSEQMKHVADTSTSTYLMSVFGVFGAIYTIAWVVSIFKSKNMNFLSKIVLTVIVMIILNKEPHHRMLFTWCLLFYAIAGKMQKERIKTEQQDSLPGEVQHGNKTTS